MKTLLATSFFTSKRVLECYAKQGLKLDYKKLNMEVFLDMHSKDTYKPDYIFKNAIESHLQELPFNELLLHQLEDFSKMLTFRGDAIYIEDNQYEKWQNTILTLSPLLMISYKAFENASQSYRIDFSELVKKNLSKTALASLYEPMLDLLIKEEGLTEMHMHLMGSTEVDIVWQDALKNPAKFYSYIQKSQKDDSVLEQYLHQGIFTQDDLYRFLKIAAVLQDDMLYFIDKRDKIKSDKYLLNNCDKLDIKYDFISKTHREKDFNDMQHEALFLEKCFYFMKENRECDNFGHMFHYYMLIHAYFQKLLTQQANQVGFDQFQKITNNELREMSEEKYNSRYKQLQGMHNDSLSTLEGRFAPKNTPKKLNNLLNAIYGGYKDDFKFSLNLVAHFIKIPDKRDIDSIITFRDLELRHKNNILLENLLIVMKQRDKDNNITFSEFVVGFDVAANELHASPEAFAPIFRKLRFLGYKNFTYHAGEDFIHLLSGIRAAYEAVEFLELQSANRIGHATALGIEPKLWAQRLYDSKLTIKRGEWLDNLIFVYHIYVENQINSDALAHIEFQIRKHFSTVYNYNPHCTLYQMIEAWKCRKYDPFALFNMHNISFLENFNTLEKKEIDEHDKQALNLLKEYHSKESIKEYNKMIEISPLEIFDEQDLRKIQNIMIEHLNKKNIAIETLPTSNVRISFYKDYSEHHISRWLGLTSQNDPKPNVVVGSDDPGIFMTNLRNEYAHIYQIIKKKSDSSTAIAKIKQLIQNSKAFTFHNS